MCFCVTVDVLLCVRLLSISSTSDDDIIVSSEFKKKRNRFVFALSHLKKIMLAGLGYGTLHNGFAGIEANGHFLLL